MGGLKPIGSEKLEGMDKMRRIMQIARYNENIPQSINETAKSEYSIELSDGHTYEIVKERLGYIIKQTINESSNYMNPIQERKYYPSYSQALKRLNLMAKEINSLLENEEETPLIGEQKKKYILKQNKKKKVDDAVVTPPPVSEPSPAPMPAPEPAPSDVGSALPPPPVDADMGSALPPPPVDADMGDMGGELPPPPSDDMGGELPPPPADADMGSDDMGSDIPLPSSDDDEEEIDVDVEEKSKSKGPSEYKRIQILVGKLAQKIRTYEEDKELSAKDVKYIINSILSAIDVDVLSDKDIEQIISKLEGEDDEEEDDTTIDIKSSDEDEDEDFGGMDDDETDLPEPDGEMGETYKNYGEAFQDYLGSAYTNAMSDDLFEDDDYDIDDTDKIFQKFEKDRKTYERPRSIATQDISKQLKKDNESRHDFKKSMIPYDTKFGNFDFEDKEDSYHDEDYDEDDMQLRRKLRGRPSNSFYHLEHGTYGESKLDKIISGYFMVSENEIKSKYEKLVESEFQLKSIIKLHKNNSNVTFMGKTNKGNLIFKDGLKESKVTKSGTIL
jgi:hypothetical protein